MKKQVYILKLYVIVSSLIFLALALISFNNKSQNQRFEEIDVERINVIEKDGSLKMVISNQGRQHPGMRDGELYDDRERPPGILFFNEEQDEVGGLGYYGNKDAGGNNVFLAFDQYKNDQVMQLMQYSKKNGDNKYGLLLWERDKEFTQKRMFRIMDSLEKKGYNYPRKMKFLKEQNGGKPIVASRLFLGRSYNSDTGLFIQDKNGKERMRFYIDSTNSPRIEVLDDKGQLVKDLLIN